MTQICKGLCQRHEAPKKANKLRYKDGEKKCGICERYFITEKWRCICCGTTLRSRADLCAIVERRAARRVVVCPAAERVTMRGLGWGRPKAFPLLPVDVPARERVAHRLA